MVHTSRMSQYASYFNFPNKPAKFGLKVVSICDTKSSIFVKTATQLEKKKARRQYGSLHIKYWHRTMCKSNGNIRSKTGLPLVKSMNFLKDLLYYLVLYESLLRYLTSTYQLLAHIYQTKGRCSWKFKSSTLFPCRKGSFTCRQQRRHSMGPGLPIRMGPSF